MAANQRNFDMFTYVDDDGVEWAKRGVVDAAINAIDGSSPHAGQAVWLDSGKRKRTRKCVYYDPTTFRTVRFTVYTAGAYAAIDPTVHLNINVPGNTAAVVYDLAEKIAEKQPVAKTSRKLADHA